ncbi:MULTISPECIES: hypothetical protein [Pseudomonas]|uniref:hypothetical protein n=1 Tax=Pseudomonas nitroreducens TaxID=46680 RepID=UPI001E6348A2|nr:MULTISPECIES: hypothetical protein [Pseudomonas]MCE4068542.1 hypothetical protein [Pseudomonas nitritireducens]MCE4077731.1 hypothetical protein [Pseudomonas nitroreducens]
MSRPIAHSVLIGHLDACRYCAVGNALFNYAYVSGYIQALLLGGHVSLEVKRRLADLAFNAFSQVTLRRDV